MAEPPNLTVIDRERPREAFRDDVLRGLTARPKTTRPSYFYDEEGAQLFEEICRLPEYYLTRTEIGIMEAERSELAACVGPAAFLVEYGSGSSTKIRILLDALPSPAGYMAIDVARPGLLAMTRELAARYPSLPVVALCADYNAADLRLPPLPAGRRVVFFPGSTIGNLTPERCLDFLARAAALVGPGGGMLLGVDLKKDAAILEPAYDDAAGVTARFNKNILARINRELDATFDLDAFAHRAFYNVALGRIEMHLVSARAQTVEVAGVAIPFAAGETIHTENSYKYTVREMQALAAEAGFRPARVFTDAQGLFAVHWLEVPAAP